MIFTQFIIFFYTFHLHSVRISWFILHIITTNYFTFTCDFVYTWIICFLFSSDFFFFFFTNDSFVLYMTFFHIWIFLCDCVFSQNDLFDVFMYFTCFLHDYFFTCDFCTVHDFLKLFVHFILTCNFYTFLHNSFLFMWLFFYIYLNHLIHMLL